eukprot:2322106-Pyramimonas_sp.AAC.1
MNKFAQPLCSLLLAAGREGVGTPRACTVETLRACVPSHPQTRAQSRCTKQEALQAIYLRPRAREEQKFRRCRAR